MMAEHEDRQLFLWNGKARYIAECELDCLESVSRKLGEKLENSITSFSTFSIPDSVLLVTPIINFKFNLTFSYSMITFIFKTNK